MDYFIIGLVSVIAIIGHVWIFLWVRFRILEGVVCKFLEDSHATSKAQAQPVETIASDSQLPLPRVHSLCRRSPRIVLRGDNAWLQAD